MSNKYSLDWQTRRKEILLSLAITPLDSRQLAKLSATFCQPFTDEVFVRRAMRRIVEAGLAKEFAYPDARKHWRLSGDGYRLIAMELAAAGIPSPKRAAFRAISPSLVHHTRRLADLLVHLQVAAHRSGLEVLELRGDRQELLQVGERTKWADGKLKLRGRGGGRKSYYTLRLELDCGTEWGYTSQTDDSLNKLIQFYLDHHDQELEPSRTIVLFDRPSPRLDRFLDRVATLNPDPRRRPIKAGLLDHVLEAHDPLRALVLWDWDKQSTSMIPGQPARSFLAPMLDTTAVRC